MSFRKDPAGEKDETLDLTEMEATRDASKEKLLKRFSEYQETLVKHLRELSFAILKQDYIPRNDFATVDNIIQYTIRYKQFDPSEKFVDDVVQSRKRPNEKKQSAKEIIVENSPLVKVYFEQVQQYAREMNEAVDSEIRHLIEKFEDHKSHKQFRKCVQSLKDIAKNHKIFIAKYIHLIRVPPVTADLAWHKSTELSKRFFDLKSVSGRLLFELDTWKVNLERLIKMLEVNQIVRVFSLFNVVGKLEAHGFSTQSSSLKDNFLIDEKVQSEFDDIYVKDLINAMKTMMDDQLQFMTEKQAKKEFENITMKVSKLADKISFKKNSDRYIQQCESAKFFD